MRPNGQAENRRAINWPLVVALIGWGGFGLVAWGSLMTRVDAHEREIDRLKSTTATERDLRNIDNRLVRIEHRLDELLQRRSGLP
jgi:hypothetical protein